MKTNEMKNKICIKMRRFTFLALAMLLSLLSEQSHSSESRGTTLSRSAQQVTAPTTFENVNHLRRPGHFTNSIGMFSYTIYPGKPNQVTVNTVGYKISNCYVLSARHYLTPTEIVDSKTTASQMIRKYGTAISASAPTRVSFAMGYHPTRPFEHHDLELELVGNFKIPENEKKQTLAGIDVTVGYIKNCSTINQKDYPSISERMMSPSENEGISQGEVNTPTTSVACLGILGGNNERIDQLQMSGGGLMGHSQERGFHLTNAPSKPGFSGAPCFRYKKGGTLENGAFGHISYISNTTPTNYKTAIADGSQIYPLAIQAIKEHQRLRNLRVASR